MEHCYYTYILTNYNRTVLYTGITNNLELRILQHYLKSISKDSFAGKYNAYYLLYFECFKYVDQAIKREKVIKGWTRDKKINLIRTINPDMKFLNAEIFGGWPPKQPIDLKSYKILRR